MLEKGTQMPDFNFHMQSTTKHEVSKGKEERFRYGAKNKGCGGCSCFVLQNFLKESNFSSDCQSLHANSYLLYTIFLLTLSTNFNENSAILPRLRCYFALLALHTVLKWLIKLKIATAFLKYLMLF